MNVASAFDAVRAEIVRDALLERGASASSAAAVVRENLNFQTTVDSSCTSLEFTNWR